MVMQGRSKTHAYRIVWVTALTLLVGVALAACDSISTVQRTPSPTIPATTTASATMPPLMSEIGWHTVFTLGDPSGKGATSIQKSFTANKTYTIFFSCKGAGTLKIEYGSNAETAPCSGTPELNGTQPLEPARSGDTVTVSVTSSGGVIWELLVSMQD
jgi:hypothetical protein